MIPPEAAALSSTSTVASLQFVGKTFIELVAIRAQRRSQ